MTVLDVVRMVDPGRWTAIVLLLIMTRSPDTGATHNNPSTSERGAQLFFFFFFFFLSRSNPVVQHLRTTWGLVVRAAIVEKRGKMRR